MAERHGVKVEKIIFLHYYEYGVTFQLRSAAVQKQAGNEGS